MVRSRIAAASAARRPPERWTSAIVAAPLFGRAESAGDGCAKAAPLQGDTRLLGVFAERDGEGYALFRLAGSRPAARAHRPGDRAAT